MYGKWLQKILRHAGVVLGDENRNDRVGALHRAWGQVFTNQLAGDYLEFGVYRGTSFLESYRQYLWFRGWLKGQLSSQEAWRRSVAGNFSDFRPHFYGFDSFSGMPDNEEGSPVFRPGAFQSSHKEVEARCRKAFESESTWSLVPGLFEDIPDGFITNPICILNIDSDLCASCRAALEKSRPGMQEGMVLLMDDYNAFRASDAKGERRALAEFSEKYGVRFEKWFAYLSGQAFLLTSTA